MPSRVDNNEIGRMITLIKQGDQEAFKRFFFLYQVDIYRFLYRFLLDKENAEDLCQETFISFWLHRDNIDPSSFPRAYLYKIAKNLAFNFLERNNPSISYDNELQRLPIILSNPEKEYENIDLVKFCEAAINELPEKCKMTFILSRYEGFDYAEIAEAMDVSLQTVKNQMSKALNQLRTKLSPIISK